MAAAKAKAKAKRVYAGAVLADSAKPTELADALLTHYYRDREQAMAAIVSRLLPEIDLPDAVVLRALRYSGVAHADAYPDEAERLSAAEARLEDVGRWAELAARVVFAADETAASELRHLLRAAGVHGAATVQTHGALDFLP